jgi:hypothetical protein
MTLVVLQKNNNVIHVAGDMKLKWSNSVSTPQNIYNWRVKVVVLNEDLCLAWAGELKFAQDALIQIWNLSNKNFDKINDILLKYNAISLDAGEETEFFLCSKNGQICKTQGRNCYNISDVGIDYIGDEDLFEKYILSKNRNEHDDERINISIFRLSDPNEEIKSDIIANIANKLIAASEINFNGNVGLGHVITSVSGTMEKGFGYHMHLYLDAPLISENIKVNQWGKIDLGNISKGAYAYEINYYDDKGHQILVYKNLHNDKLYFFGDFSDGVPKYNEESLITLW